MGRLIYDEHMYANMLWVAGLWCQLFDIRLGEQRENVWVQLPFVFRAERTPIEMNENKKLKMFSENITNGDLERHPRCGWLFRECVNNKILSKFCLNIFIYPLLI